MNFENFRREIEDSFDECAESVGQSDEEMCGLVVFGSHAEGTATPESDIDVMVESCDDIFGNEIESCMQKRKYNGKELDLYITSDPELRLEFLRDVIGDSRDMKIYDVYEDEHRMLGDV